MRLVWVVNRKPTKGNETEFRKLQKKLNKAIGEDLELFTINKEELNEDQIDEYESIIKAIEWLKFWGTNGHGFSCSY
jgi:hypothetical protein